MPFLLVAVAQRAMPTSVMACARFVLASATLLVLAGFRRRPLAALADTIAMLRRQPVQLIAVALTLAVVPNLLIGAGERHVATGVSSVLVATTPLWIAVGARFGSARDAVGPRQGLALAGAFTGSALLTQAAVPRDHLAWAVLPLLAAFSYAFGNLAVRRWFQQVDALALTLGEMALAALLTGPLALGRVRDVELAATPWAAAGALGVFCSGIGWVTAMRLVQRAGPTRASLPSFSSTVVAVVLGAVVLGERVSAREAVGAAVVVISIAAFLMGPSGSRARRYLKGETMLELCILGFLAEQPLHAYNLRRRVATLMGHVQPISDGALYPALNRLVKSHLIAGRVEKGHGGPPRRVFRLTAAGKTELQRRLSEPSDMEISDRNRYFVVLAFLHLLPDAAQRDAVLRRRLEFLDRPGRGFFRTAERPLRSGQLGTPYREGMQEIARKTSAAERAWLRRMLAPAG